MGVAHPYSSKNEPTIETSKRGKTKASFDLSDQTAISKVSPTSLEQVEQLFKKSIEDEYIECTTWKIA